MQYAYVLNHHSLETKIYLNVIYLKSINLYYLLYKYF